MELKISSPCPKSWDDLVGNDRVRYCGQCRLNVYNLAEMPREEIEALVRSTEGRLCGRLYMRGDRKAAIRDCGGYRARQVLRRGMTAAALLVLGAFAWAARSADGPDRRILPTWAQAVLDVIDPPRQTNPRPPMMLGEIRCVPPPRATPPGPSGS